FLGREQTERAQAQEVLGLCPLPVCPRVAVQGRQRRAQVLLTALEAGAHPLLLLPRIGRGQPIEALSKGVLVLALGIGQLGDAVFQLAECALSSAGLLLALVPLPARQPQRSDGDYQRQQGRCTATAGIAWFVPRTGGG